MYLYHALIILQAQYEFRKTQDIRLKDPRNRVAEKIMERKFSTLEDGHTYGKPNQTTPINDLLRNVFGEIGEQIARQRQDAVAASRNNDTK